MRAVVKSGPVRGFQLQEVEDPKPAPDGVVVAVGAASICGSDRPLYEHDARAPQPLPPGMSLPVVVGHEVAGTITAVGRSVTELRPGQRVAVESHLHCGRCFQCCTGSAHVCEQLQILGFHLDGAFAEQVAVPASTCFSLPDSVSLEAGALFEPIGVAVHATQRAGDLAGAVVLVSGCGPIGLAVVQLALLFGAAQVIALDPNGARRARAKALGADAFDPREHDPVTRCRAATGRRGGVDVTFDAAGVASTIPSLFACTRTGGRVVAVGLPSPVEIDVTREVVLRSITLTGAFGRRLWETWELLLQVVESGRFDLEAIVAHRVGLEEVDRAMELLADSSGKVLVQP